MKVQHRKHRGLASHHSVAGIGLGQGALGSPRLHAAAPGPATPHGPSEYVNVGSRRQLLFDDFFVARGKAEFESYPHNIRWSCGKTEKTPAESISFDKQPWETGAAWLCALYDGGRYRLWYHLAGKSAQPAPGELPEGASVGYAESDDGLNWRKPLLKVAERYGFKENNVVFAGWPDASGVEFGSVFIDPAARSEERYKMLYTANESRQRVFVPDLPWTQEAGVLRGAYSSDGINWTRYQHNFLGKYCDSQNVATYDPVLGKYVAYIRGVAYSGGLVVGENPVKEGRQGRAVARMESDDYKEWSYPEIVLSSDFYDGLGLDIYNNGYSRYEGAENAHFMFSSALHHREGQWRPKVAVSRDNRTWVRPTREVFIPLGESGSFDDSGISVAPGFLPAGKDHLALYYRPYSLRKGTAIARFQRIRRQPARPAHLGRVVFKRDRIVGIEAGAEEGTFWTRPLEFQGRELVLNVEPTGPDPQLRVQLVCVETQAGSPQGRASYEIDAVPQGYGFEDSVPLTRDELDGVARWKAGAALGHLAGRPIRLHFRLKSLRIYAFQFVG